MDKIYSRKVIKLPKILYKNFNSKYQNKKTIKFLIILAIAILTFSTVIKNINPIFTNLCKEKAKSLATIICNEESTKIIKEYQYEDLVTIYRDANDNITMIKSNITPINLIISDVAEKIQKRINEIEQETIGIKLGSIIGIKAFSGMGPTINIKISTKGNVKTELKSEFSSAGINQTIHRIYLQVDCELNVLTRYNGINESISNQVLIAENVIVGKIPDTYYNLEGINSSDAIDVME